ncbi:lysosomal alpha-glucosidase-like isoform X3 [Manduca sexta]|nr:lysosomal alpha-glucosidase-like isoform X3 [Manduca sexta]XP_037294753.1 lysosomal alpha-glucosidase-like isoform X3 [Manduca sexta]
MLGITLVCALCVGAWWAVGGAMGGAWGEEHYRKLWERTHPESVKKPLSPMPYEKVSPEYRYHDHNNLSTKNRSNATEARRKNEYNKKSYSERPAEVMQDMCAKVAENMRFDCYPQGEVNEENCARRGCCWKSTDTIGVPYCYYPSQYDTFRFLNMTEDKHAMTVYYEKARPSGYPDDFETVRMDFKYLSDDVLGVKIYDPENKRFEPPYPEISLVSKPLGTMKYRVQIEGSLVGFKVIRNSDNVTIFNTQDVGGLILSNKMLQISAVLPTDRVFGLGEKRARFMNNMNWNTIAIFNRDRVPREGMNLYGSHPFYLAVEQNGNSHGALLLNSNAMDVVLQPTPGITYRTIGGVLNLFVFAGPSPKDVVSQYTELIGRPFMPPYWALGFHLCKFEYGNLNVTKQVWQANRDAGIPFDVQWNDIDYMRNRNDFTYDKEKFAELPQFVNKIHSEGMHYMIIIDPGISASEKPGTYPPYDRGIEMDVFVKNNTNQPFIGKVWNTGSTVFPDFTHPNSTAYWVEMMTNFHKKVAYDGAWIDMNEPSNFEDGPLVGSCLPEALSYLPHTSDPYLRAHTLCMDARHAAGPHYDLHNLYAITEAIATNFALQEIRGKRPFIISRASSVGLGHFAGHWSGDVASDWHDMRMSIPELLSFSLFGIPMMGADICGFTGNTTAELCTRWMQLGAFYPFSRNHNSDSSIPQDPVSLGPSVVQASRESLRLRYRLLPYYYTLFWRAHVFGDTVVRPLFFESPENTLLHDIDDQFLVGPYIMVTPVLQQGASHTSGMFPGPQSWYNVVDGAFIDSGRRRDVTDNQTVSVRGGAIIPLQEPPARGPVTTTNSRSSPMQLLVVPDNEDKARGQLYWDDGDSLNSYEEKKYSHIEFMYNNLQIKSRVNWWGYGVPSINRISVYNQTSVKTVSINDVPCVKPCQFTYLSDTKVLQIDVSLPLDNPFEVKWVSKAKESSIANLG